VDDVLNIVALVQSPLAR